MSLPLSALTYYRMPDATLAAATIAGMIDALYTALSSATDFLGTALPASHTWTWTKRGASEAVDGVPPAGTLAALAPRLLWAGHGVSTGTMAAPDTWLANGLHVGINKNSGAYNAYTAALPFTAGQWFGFWRCAPTAANAVGTIVRAFISQESVFVQVIQAATTQYWCLAGAILEGYSDTSGTTVESDSRLYGIVTGGSTAINAGFLASNGNFLDHVVSAGNPHGGTFQPGASALWSSGRAMLMQSTGAATTTMDADGKYVGRPVDFCRSTGSAVQNGIAVGVLRGLWLPGLMQSGRRLHNGAGTIYYHYIGVDTANPDDAIMLKAA